jgi:hypothetical protein
MLISSVSKNMSLFFALLIVPSITISANVSANDSCHAICFPEKIYDQCTTKINSLTLDEKALCNQMTTDCQTCTDEKNSQLDQPKKQCNDICSTEQLIKCNKKTETLSLKEKAKCNQMNEDCQICTERKKTQSSQSQNKCAEICNTEQLIHCHKKAETLSIKEKANCSQMASDCQTCIGNGQETPDQ